MDSPTLMLQLMEIERALGRRDASDIRNMILSAQDAVLHLERENEQLARQNAGLRRSLDAVHRSSLRVAAQLHAAPVTDPGESSADSATGDDSNQRTWRSTHLFFSN
ncbi:MAG: hypothetical protein WA476_11290 [Acidobacteriaceae bacterium]